MMPTRRDQQNKVRHVYIDFSPPIYPFASQSLYTTTARNPWNQEWPCIRSTSICKTRVVNGNMRVLRLSSPIELNSRRQGDFWNPLCHPLIAFILSPVLYDIKVWNRLTTMSYWMRNHSSTGLPLIVIQYWEAALRQCRIYSNVFSIFLTWARSIMIYSVYPTKQAPWNKNLVVRLQNVRCQVVLHQVFFWAKSVRPDYPIFSVIIVAATANNMSVQAWFVKAL
jgi:hypothetical protein